MRRPLRLRHFLIVLPLGLAAAIVACGGGDDSSVTGDDGGSDALTQPDTNTSGDGAKGDTGSGDDASTTSPLCTALASFDQRCNRTDACSQGELANCSTLASALSPSAQQAEATCRNDEACPGTEAGVKKSYDACIADAIAALIPSVAQNKLATDACAICAPDAGGCVANFYRDSDAGKAGPGVDLLVYSDAVIQDIDTSCFGADAGTCAFGSGCVKKAIERHLPARPAACASDAGDAGDGGD